MKTLPLENLLKELETAWNAKLNPTITVQKLDEPQCAAIDFLRSNPGARRAEFDRAPGAGAGDVGARFSAPDPGGFSVLFVIDKAGQIVDGGDRLRVGEGTAAFEFEDRPPTETAGPLDSFLAVVMSFDRDPSLPDLRGRDFVRDALPSLEKAAPAGIRLVQATLATAKLPARYFQSPGTGAATP